MFSASLPGVMSSLYWLPAEGRSTSRYWLWIYFLPIPSFALFLLLLPLSSPGTRTWEQTTLAQPASSSSSSQETCWFTASYFPSSLSLVSPLGIVEIVEWPPPYPKASLKKKVSLDRIDISGSSSLIPQLKQRSSLLFSGSCGNKSMRLLCELLGCTPCYFLPVLCPGSCQVFHCFLA